MFRQLTSIGGIGTAAVVVRTMLMATFVR